MFTVNQIKEAHSKVKTGADYPGYVQELIKFGVIHYDTYLSDGHTEYKGRDNYQVQTNGREELLEIAVNSNPEKFLQSLKEHQQGKSDFPAFCRQAAKAGVEKWSVDMYKMTCTYYDKAGNKMLVEEIPVG